MVSDLALSPQSVMLLALMSAFSRAGLNLIDRRQIGHLGQSVILVNFWNNLAPAVVLVGGVCAFGSSHELIESLLDLRTLFFSGLVQLVAYAYSHAFKRLDVNRVTVAGKAADLFIPVGLYLVAGRWDWVTYGFAVATTLTCLPLMWRARVTRVQGLAPTRLAALLIGSALVLQAGFSPLLAQSEEGTSTLEQSFVFATAVIVWRVAYCMLPMLATTSLRRVPAARAVWASPLFIARAVLSVSTQVAFVAAVGSPLAALAWPILNSTGILAMVLSSLILRERPSRLEAGVVSAIAVLALMRFLML